VVLPLEHASGDLSAVDFGGAVIDAERAYARNMRVTIVSSVMPRPPRICMLPSPTRQIASEQMTAAILDSCVPRPPWSGTPAVYQIRDRLIRRARSLPLLTRRGTCAPIVQRVRVQSWIGSEHSLEF